METECIGVCELDIDGKRCIGCGRKIENIEEEKVFI